MTDDIQQSTGEDEPEADEVSDAAEPEAEATTAEDSSGEPEADSGAADGGDTAGSSEEA